MAVGREVKPSSSVPLKPPLLGHHKDIVGTGGQAKVSMSETQTAAETAIGDGLVHKVGDSAGVTDHFVQRSPSGSPNKQEAAGVTDHFVQRSPSGSPNKQEAAGVTDHFVQRSPSGSPNKQEATVGLSPVASPRYWNDTSASSSPFTSPRGQGVVPVDSSGNHQARSAGITLNRQNGQVVNLKGSSPGLSYNDSAHRTQVDVAVES